MKRIFILFLFVFFRIVSAETYLNMGFVPDGAVRPLFGDDVNMRSGPSLKNETLVRLKAGTMIVVISRTEIALNLGSYSDYWYKVKAEVDKRQYTGYIWGGLISKACAEGDFDFDGKKDILAAGITHCDEEGRKWAQIRLLSGGVIRDSVLFRLGDFTDNPQSENYKFFNYSVSMDILSGRYENFTVVKLESYYEACDYPGYFYLAATDGKKIFLVAQENFSSGEGGGIEVSASVSEKGISMGKHSYENIFGESGDASVKTVEKSENIYVFEGNNFNKK